MGGFGGQLGRVSGDTHFAWAIRATVLQADDDDPLYAPIVIAGVPTVEELGRVSGDTHFAWAIRSRPQGQVWAGAMW